MYEYLEPHSLVAEAIMASEGTKLVLVVEGDLDEHLFRLCTKAQSIEFVNARGKPRIKMVLPRLLRDVGRVVVVLDRDFDDALGLLVNDPRVVYTDYYNLEAELLRHPGICGTVWGQHARGQALRMPSESVMESCLRVATELGYIRLTSMLGDYGLALSDFPTVSVVVDKVTLELDYLATLDIVVRRSKGSRLWINMCRRHSHDEESARTACVRRLSREVSRSKRMHPSVDVASGHDIASAMNVLIGGIRKGGVPSARDLEWHAVALVPDHGGLPFMERVKTAAERQGCQALFDWYED